MLEQFLAITDAMGSPSVVAVNHVSRNRTRSLSLAFRVPVRLYNILMTGDAISNYKARRIVNTTRGPLSKKFLIAVP